MFFKFKRRARPEDSSAFSEFIRNASSREKKRVYMRVIEKSIESQKKMLDKAGD